MIAIYSGLLLLALLLVILLRYWHAEGVLEARASGAHAKSSAPGVGPVPTPAGREQVQVTARTLWRLQKEARELKEMAEHIIADATDAEQEIEVLIGGRK